MVGWRVLAVVIMSIAGSAAVGCGSFANTICGPVQPEGPRPYDGVRMDVDMIRNCSQEALTPSCGGELAVGAAAMAALCTVDLPLSAIADTLAIPFLLRQKDSQSSE